jgi:hypothetical protein
MLTLYRRHAERCPVHESKVSPRAKRKYMDCDCPLWVYGNTETTHVPRQSTGTSVLAVAEAQRKALLKNGQDQKVHGPRVDDCIERFIASRKEELGEKTAASYRFQLDRLRAYCTSHGAHFMRELSVDLLEDFKVDGLPDNMAATSKAQVTAKIRCFLREAYRRSWTEFALAEKVRPYRATHEQKNPYSDAVTGHTRSPRWCQHTSRLVSRILFWRDHRRMAGVGVQWDRILACIGMTGIPAAGRMKTGFGAPGKSSRAVFAFLCPRPPLGDFTKEMGLIWGRGTRGECVCLRDHHFADRSGSQPSRADESCAGGSYQPISSEPAPSHRPWASARARPFADNR